MYVCHGLYSIRIRFEWIVFTFFLPQNVEQKNVLRNNIANQMSQWLQQVVSYTRIRRSIETM